MEPITFKAIAIAEALIKYINMYDNPFEFVLLGNIDGTIEDCPVKHYDSVEEDVYMYRVKLTEPIYHPLLHDCKKLNAEDLVSILGLKDKVYGTAICFSSKYPTNGTDNI